MFKLRYTESKYDHQDIVKNKLELSIEACNMDSN